MCTVTLELPDDVVELAKKQGLLSPEALEAYIKAMSFGDGTRENAANVPGNPAVSLLDLRGSCKGIDTMDAYFERKRADKAIEDAV